MKKITMKAVKATHTHVIKVGYCRLQHLLTYKCRYAYTAGYDGWHSDIYSVGTVAISTGYQPFGDIKPDYETVKKYDDQATEILASRADDVALQLNDLLHKFIGEVVS